MRQGIGLLILTLLLGGISCVSPPDPAYEKNEVGNRLFREERFEEALDAYLQAQVERPELPELNFNAGAALYKKQDYQRALRETQRSLSSQDLPLQAKAYYNLGNVYFRTDRLAEAAEEYKKALRLAPDDADAKYNLEYVQRLLEDMEQRENAAQAQRSPGELQEGEDPQRPKGEDRAQEGQRTAPRTGEDYRSPDQLRSALEEAGEDLTIEKVLRILDALQEQERRLQATLAEGEKGPFRKADKDW